MCALVTEVPWFALPVCAVRADRRPHRPHHSVGLAQADLRAVPGDDVAPPVLGADGVAVRVWPAGSFPTPPARASMLTMPMRPVGAGGGERPEAAPGGLVTAAADDRPVVLRAARRSRGAIEVGRGAGREGRVQSG